MKFMYFFLPTLPATPAERRALRPIAHHTERWQRMFEEVVEVSRLAEDLGFDAVCFPEHHYPYEEGTPWLPHQWTREFGAPGELDEHGRIQKIDVVPKPYQKPHPPLFQAFSMSEETIRWCARENITPTVLISQPDKVNQFARAYQEEARSVGRMLDFGQGFGVLHAVYTAANREQAKQIAEAGICGVAFRQFFYHFGFFDAWRTPEDEIRYPSAKGLLPASECTI